MSIFGWGYCAQNEIKKKHAICLSDDCQEDEAQSYNVQVHCSVITNYTDQFIILQVEKSFIKFLD